MTTDDPDRPTDDGATGRSDPSTGQLTAAAAEVYESFFVPALFSQWPERVLGLAGATTGQRVLDVGCGTGVAARFAAGLVGGSGRVVGVDPNTGMLDVARSVAPDIEWRIGTAEALPCDDDEFDVVTSQFAAMFFTDRAAALSEMARVCRPRGTVAVVTWADASQSPGYARMIDLVERLFGTPPADALRAPFAIGTPGELESIMTPHLDDVRVRRVDGLARFASIESWVHTDVRGWTLHDLIDDEQFLRLVAAAQSDLADLTLPDGRVEFDAPALVGTGRVPIRRNTR